MKPFAPVVEIETPEAETAVARLDKRTKSLGEGEVAIIDHTDVDRVSAESLIERKPCCVVNAACSVTGSYPNLGPLMMVASGLTVLDEVGQGIFEKVHEGDRISVVGDRVVAAFTTGTDFGTQSGPFIGRKLFDEFFAPRYRKIFDCIASFSTTSAFNRQQREMTWTRAFSLRSRIASTR